MNIKEWFPEFKVSAEADTDLHKYFVKTNHVDAIFLRAKWLVLGRKGTGKTAIYEYSKSSDPHTIGVTCTIPLSFKDYPWPVHRLYKEIMEGEVVAYQKSWHYLFVVQALAQLINARERNGIILSRSLQNIKSLFNKIYGNPFPSLIEVIKSKIARIRKLELPSLTTENINFTSGTINFEEISQSQELQSLLRTNSFTFLNYLDNILANEIKTDNIIILLDQLDENWLESEIGEYSKILINLINSAQTINNSNKYNKRLRIIIFLRTDIYETLRFNDKNKIFQDSAVEIRWDDSTLEDMVMERIKQYAPSNIELDYSLKSGCIFERKTVRHGAPPFRYILRRTFYRPRDVIVYLNKIRDVYRDSKSGLYTSKNLYEAEKEFSNSIYNELIDEWINQKPEIDNYLVSLQSIGVQTFTSYDFHQSFKYQTGEGEIIGRDALRFLFNNSIIGQKISVNWVYNCMNPHILIDFDRPFHVNNGLKARLNLTESRTPRR
jgi:hypothetical protein